MSGIDEQVAAFRAELDTLPTGKPTRPWSVWRDPLTWALAAATIFAVGMTILG